LLSARAANSPDAVSSPASGEVIVLAAMKTFQHRPPTLMMLVDARSS
jgi:hypothetical protein